MNRVVDILMKRDGLSYEEALEEAKNAAEEIINFPNDYHLILEYDLGLEPDYLMDLFDLVQKGE